MWSDGGLRASLVQVLLGAPYVANAPLVQMPLNEMSVPLFEGGLEASERRDEQERIAATSGDSERGGAAQEAAQSGDRSGQVLLGAPYNGMGHDFL
jgi:hypothetical protein